MLIVKEGEKMYISNVFINNFRIFSEEDKFCIGEFNIPTDQKEGSGLTVLVGENGCGKTTILDSIAYSVIEYKADSFSISDITDIKKLTDIKVYAKENFEVLGTMPKAKFEAKGFNFVGKMRNRGTRNYLQSLLVHDQLFIKSDPDKPADGSSDLRLCVNNPFAGKRFNDTDIIYIDKNRLFQTRSGTYNDTKFDRLMEDFSFQYNKKITEVEDLNFNLSQTIKKDKVESEMLEEVIKKFQEISQFKVQLDFIDNCKPFDNAKFVIKQNNNQQIGLSNLGSGYEMMFSLLYSYYMSRQQGKNTIILIDEPELHLHPKIQQKFVDFLLEISKETQIIITTHSPLLVKQLAYNDNVKYFILNSNKTYASKIDIKLPYISANEINYLAFGVVTEEYHNELYETLYNRYLTNGGISHIKTFDNTFFVKEKGEKAMWPWKGNPNQVSLNTYVRNQIHHQADMGKVNEKDMESSIKQMRQYI